MLDKNILDQLNTVFSKLEQSIQLEYANCDHEKESELLELVQQVAR